MSTPGEEAPWKGLEMQIVIAPERIAVNDQALSTMEGAIGLVPGQITGLEAKALGHHFTGMYRTDEQLLGAALNSIQETTEEISANFNMLQTGDFYASQTRAQRRSKKRFSAQQPDTARFMHEYTRLEEDGCYSDIPLARIVISSQVTYAPEVGRQLLENISAEVNPQELAAYFREDPRSDITDERLIAKIRERKAPDHTQETLDARFASFVGTANVLVVKRATEALIMFARAGGRARADYATTFFNEYKETILDKDLAKKIDVYTQLHRGIRKFVESETNRDVKRYLQIMTGAAESYATSVNKMIAFFESTYEHFGYEKPAMLRPAGEDAPETPEAVGTSEDTKTDLEGAVGSVAVNEVELASAFQKLDQFVLPPNATTSDIDKELQRIGVNQSEVTKVQWERLRDLVTLCNQGEDGLLYRSKEKSLGSTPPYFVAAFAYSGKKYAVAESPVFGNATYIIAEDHAPGTWQEMLELPKPEVIALGARRVRHATNAPHGPEHVQKIWNTIQDMHVTQGL